MIGLFLVYGFIIGTLFLVSVFILDCLIWRHDLPTSNEAISQIVNIVKELRPDANNFYDLGCARGKLAINIKKSLPKMAVFGIDKHLFRILFAFTRAKIYRQKVNFICQDFFKTNLKNADIIYLYLDKQTLLSLEKKLTKELKAGTLMITNTNPLISWKPIKTVVVHPKTPDFEKLFVYLCIYTIPLELILSKIPDFEKVPRLRRGRKSAARAGREGKGFQGKGIPAPPSLPPPQIFMPTKLAH